MKKIYITAEIKVMKVQMSSHLCASPVKPTIVDIYGDTGDDSGIEFGGGSNSDARSNNFWLDDE